MSTFHIVNFGCRATQADAAAIERQLLGRGYAPAGEARDARVVVLNTCTVTSDADAVARQAIRRVHRENPAAQIIVTGCYAQRAPEELAEIPGVSWVVGNSHKPQIPGLVAQAFLPVKEADLVQIGSHPALTILVGDLESSAFAEMQAAQPGMAAPHDHTRPVLKIQDGCNNRCAFCVIPFVRGRSRSLPPAQVVEEITRLATAGAKEIVLSGINLGSYGRDLAPRAELGDLVRRILGETPLERLRLSSVEPMDVTQDLVELVASSRRIARHFHVPLQSGSDRILAAMHRWYRAEHYARRIELIRERLPEAAIGADVIAGFPGETDEDHRATLRLIESLPFTYLHVFAYSKRPGTKAATFSGEVPPQVIKQRSKELRALAAAKGVAFRRAQVGQTLRVLTLNRQGKDLCSPGLQTRGFSGPASKEAGYKPGAWTPALSDNFLKIRLAGLWPANQLLDVLVTAEDGGRLRATPRN